MMNLILQYKPFNISLDTVEAYMRENYPAYAGNSASNDELILWFSEAISEETKQEILDYWESIDESSAEATSYVSKHDIKQAIEAAKRAAIDKSWDQMNVVERKIVMGMTPTKAELIAAELL